MKTLTHLLVSLVAGLLVAALVNACAPQPGATPATLAVETRPVTTSSPSPLPPTATIGEATNPPSEVLAGSATPAPPAGPTSTPDLMVYDRQASQSISPDGRHAARVVVAMPFDSQGKAIGDTYHVQVDLLDFQDNSQQVVVDEWRNYGLGFTTPRVLGWTADNRAFLLVDSGVPDGCGPVFTENLRRADVASGEASPLAIRFGQAPSLSPDGSRLASIGEGELLVADLDSGVDQALPFEAPDSAYWAGEITWAPDGKRLLFLALRDPCEIEGKSSSSLYLADLAKGSASPLLEADSLRLIPLSWPLDDLVQLRDPQGQDYWLQVSSGQISKEPPADIDAAREALYSFFSALQAGNYQQAVGFYGGPYEELQANNPDIDPQNQAALLENACQLNGFQCLAVQQAVLIDQAAQGEYHFRVAFDQDGQTFVLGPCCGADIAEMPPLSEFVYTVKQDEAGNYRVQELPVFVP